MTRALQQSYAIFRNLLTEENGLVPQDSDSDQVASLCLSPTVALQLRIRFRHRLPPSEFERTAKGRRSALGPKGEDLSLLCEVF